MPRHLEGITFQGVFHSVYKPFLYNEDTQSARSDIERLVNFSRSYYKSNSTMLTQLEKKQFQNDLACVERFLANQEIDASIKLGEFLLSIEKRNPSWFDLVKGELVGEIQTENDQNAILNALATVLSVITNLECEVCSCDFEISHNGYYLVYESNAEKVLRCHTIFSSTNHNITVKCIGLAGAVNICRLIGFKGPIVVFCVNESLNGSK